MIRKITRRQLRKRLPYVLEAVELGDTFEVTRNGKVVAILSPASADPLAGLSYLPALVRGGFVALPKHVVFVPTRQALDELREERLPDAGQQA